jgi:uncharacterized protein
MSDTSVQVLAGVDPEVDVPPQPLPNVDTEGFWEATRRGELALCRCRQCRSWMHPPLERCRSCSGETTFEVISGRGRIHSFIVMHRASVPGLGPPPHVVVLVEFDDAPGIRLTGMLTGVPAEAVEVGAPVQARIVEVPGGSFRAPEFVLDPGESSGMLIDGKLREAGSYQAIAGSQRHLESQDVGPSGG